LQGRPRQFNVLCMSTYTREELLEAIFTTTEKGDECYLIQERRETFGSVGSRLRYIHNSCSRTPFLICGIAIEPLFGYSGDAVAETSKLDFTRALVQPKVVACGIVIDLETYK
jgi:hypothetical protein